ncbi:MAG TPA: alpha-L-fucosidase [Acidobacteriaceae bacterium]|jgi:alpha-L-fucosidase|nr:alpha-L-fucosidase [Acidobacteriaceae bacterium]
MNLFKVAKRSTVVFLVIFSMASIHLQAQSMYHYQPTIASLDHHPLPQWYADAKLGIFIHWGLYSVPGWAPLIHPNHDFSTKEYMKNNPYAEWYYNSMRIDGSPTQAYHREHYGANFNYYNFATDFDRESMKWHPEVWAKIFKDAGAKYVVLTTKHHEGFTLWPSSIPNPTLPKDRQHATRDIVGELTAAVRKSNMRMGLYYSGGLDWTFVPGPITDRTSFENTKPESAAYGAYAFSQVSELIKRYHPAVLWNDIDWPKTGRPLQLMAEYYNTVPDGVIDDRFGIPHSDFITPEYATINKISAKKWEECRGLGRSFGYNRAEGEAETIAPDKLIYLLVDIVSKNGNLLLDVGPEADGTIPAVQMERLHALGKWLSQNGDAIYGTHPWKRAEGDTAEGIPVRFTEKGSHVYATLLGEPKSGSITLRAFQPKPGSNILLLGYAKPLSWAQQGEDVKVKLPHTLPGRYAYVLRITTK